MKIYTIIGGVNGVGKSSLSGVLSAENGDLGVIIDTDRITAEIGGDKIAGAKAAVERISECLESGKNFTQETTLSGAKTLKTVRRARELGYRVRLYYVGISAAEESIKRIANRVEKGGHDIPTEDVRRRYAKRFADLAKILPCCDEVRFYDNENGFAEKGEYSGGRMVLRGTPPRWLEELDDYLKNMSTAAGISEEK